MFVPTARTVRGMIYRTIRHGLWRGHIQGPIRVQVPPRPLATEVTKTQIAPLPPLATRVTKTTVKRSPISMPAQCKTRLRVVLVAHIFITAGRPPGPIVALCMMIGGTVFGSYS